MCGKIKRAFKTLWSKLNLSLISLAINWNQSKTQKILKYFRFSDRVSEINNHFILVIFFAVEILIISALLALIVSWIFKTELKIETINLIVTAIFGSGVILGFGVKESK